MRKYLYGLIVAYLTTSGGCLMTGCASEEKRDAFLPSTVRNIELTNLNLLEGQKTLSAQHELLAGSATSEEVAALNGRFDELSSGIEVQMKNGLDATLPELMKGYDNTWEIVMATLAGGSGLGILGSKRKEIIGAIAGKKAGEV